MNPRTEAARALWDVRGLFHGHRAAREARDLMARLSARAVGRWDWHAATTYAASYEMLDEIHRRSIVAALDRRMGRAS